VALKMKLDSKKLLKHVLVGTSIKRWTKAVSRKNQRTRKDRTISVILMEMIFDSDTGAIGRSGWFSCRDNHLACVILIEAFVLSTVTQWVLRSIEGFLDEQSNWTWTCRRRGLQDDWFNGRRAGWMNGDDDKTTVGKSVSYLRVRNFPWRYYPVCSFEASNEHFNAMAIMVLDDDGHNNG
jgi:hypothetical protein